MFALATPSSMMSAFRVGRYRDAMDCASWKMTTAAQQVAHPAAEDQQPAEREDVGVDDPGQGCGRDAKFILDRRQCDVGDGVIQHQHQLRGRNNKESDAQAAFRRLPQSFGLMRGDCL